VCVCVCVCVYSQKLQLLTATSIRTPIPYGSFVTEKLGLKMEFPKVEFTEENSIRSRSEPVVSEWEHKQLVRTHCGIICTIQYNINSISNGPPTPTADRGRITQSVQITVHFWSSELGNE